jgi:hypothetical protein
VFLLIQDRIHSIRTIQSSTSVHWCHAISYKLSLFLYNDIPVSWLHHSISQQVQLAVYITLQSPASWDNRMLAFLKIMTAPRIAGKLMLQSLYPVLLDSPVTCCLHPPCQNHDSDLYKTQIGHLCIRQHTNVHYHLQSITLFFFALDH